MWERSFIAMSVLLSAPIDDTLAVLPPNAETRAVDLVAKLRDGRRHVRAAALATVGQEIALAVSEITLR